MTWLLLLFIVFLGMLLFIVDANVQEPVGGWLGIVLVTPPFLAIPSPPQETATYGSSGFRV